MKTVILAGGKGSRLSQYTGNIPKPMVSIGEVPILEHIMNFYSYYNYNNFLIALGYKSRVIKEYFINYNNFQMDLKIKFPSGNIDFLNDLNKNWIVSLIDTGEETMTGGRIKRLQSYIGNETFFCTYGDGLSDVNLNQLLKFHQSHGKMITVTAVKPPSRFGELTLKGENHVVNFKEKPKLSEGWINGGFFVINPKIFEFIKDDKTIFEKEVLEKVASIGEIRAFKHKGFWQCLDNSRDKEYLENLIETKNTPWIL